MSGLKLISATAVLGISLLSSNASALASVSVSASVNLVDGPNVRSVPGSNANASVTASGVGGNASATASDSGSLSAISTSTNSFLTTPASASAGFSTGYILTGNPNNVSIPLTFNFGLNGSLNASSVPNRLGGLSLGTASYTYNLFNSGSRTAGNATLQSSSGIPIFSSSGSFGSGARLGARITPVLNIQGNVDIDGEAITPDDFRELANEAGRSEAERLLLNQIADTLTKDILLEQFNTDASLLQGTIINAISAFGLPRLNIPSGGGSLGLGFNTNFFFDTNIKLQQQVQQGGSLLGVLTTFASSSSFEASASANFGNTLKLLSVSVPQDFNTVDISNLKVVLDSGLVLDVVRETGGSNGNNGGGNNGEVSVPEPSFGLALLTFSIFGLFSRQNKKRTSSFNMTTATQYPSSNQS